MDKPASNDYPIDDLLRRRWSPRAFAADPVSDAELRSLFEAARWAASSYNEQPWVYIVARQEDVEAFERLASVLQESNLLWARHAPVLALSLARRIFARNGAENLFALHDVGAASAQLTVQATALHLYVHQMAGIDRAKAREVFRVPDDYDPVVALAIGHPGDPDTLPDSLKGREQASRQRKPLAEFVFGAEWGESAPFLQG